MNKICRPNSRNLCGRENCQMCLPKSFALHPKAQYWSTKNNCQPIQIRKSVSDKYLFKCDKCPHEFKISLGKITTQNRWCAYCANQKLCTDDNCQICFLKSFAQHPKSIHWSLKNNLSPRKVFLSSNLKYWFDCHCGHEFEKCLSSITKLNQWCGYCSPKKCILCSKDDCHSCRNRSFAAHPRSKYWSPKNKLSPRHVVIGTKDKYLFICEYGHEFEISLDHIVHSKNWCNRCPKKTEAKLYEKLINYGYEIKGQANFDWCRSMESKKFLPFDFLIEEYKIIVELDGNQHFKQISNWRTPEEQQKIDLYKMDCANKEGYTIVRIYQEDVLYDCNNWWEKLESHFYIHNIPTKVFISSGNQYDCFNK
ncbi:hypothetical protein PV-S19_0136 [Pacmanvirus S19]|nr:hypothetical protein PV-S19_0136 [Pacmanvirus S19]